MQPPREYHSLREAADALDGRLGRAATPCLFDRLDWFDLLHGHCFADAPVRIFQAVEGRAEAWLFLVSPEARRLSALANWYSFSWTPHFFGAPDAATRRRLLTGIARRIAHDVAHVDLYPVARDDGMAPLLLAAFRRAGWFAMHRPYGGRYTLDVAGRDFASWWAQRPGPLRTLVQRRSKRAGLDIHISNRLTADDWRDYVAVSARSWKEPETGLPFLRALAERESEAGALRLGFARLDGRAIATQLWTTDHGAALIHKLAHDRAFDALSPGTLLSHAMFAYAIDVDRVATIDYGTGDNGYKTDWMDGRQTLYRIDCYNPRYPSSWTPAARTAISALVG